MPEMKPHINSYKFVEHNIRKDYNEKNVYYFFDDRLDNLLQALQHLRYKKNEVILFHVQD